MQGTSHQGRDHRAVTELTTRLGVRMSQRYRRTETEQDNRQEIYTTGSDNCGCCF